MTTEIAVLNRSAVALAADSAVTIGSGGSAKVYNHANKLFTLSKYHPIGMMLYGSANYMGVPWETIIKVFREKLGDKNLDTVEEFSTKFVRFVKSYIECTEEQQKQRVFEIWYSQLKANFQKLKYINYLIAH